MSGIDYGKTYKSRKGIRMGRETGVIYSELSKKYIVRIKKQNGHVSTRAQFINKEDAEKLYNSLIEDKTSYL